MGKYLWTGDAKRGDQKKRPSRRERPPKGKIEWTDALLRGAGAGCPLLGLDGDGAVAILVRFLDESLLLLRVLLEERLGAQQQAFIGQRLRVFGFELDRLVDRLQTGAHELDLVGLRRR